MADISLTDEQTEKLMEIAQSAPELIMHRARLILAYAQGKPTLQAALQAGISRGRARYWKRQFLSRGLDIFNADTSRALAGEKPAVRLYAVGDNLIREPSGAHAGEIEKAVSADIAYPTPHAGIGLQADDSLAEAGKKVWLYHFAIMISHESGTRLGEDIEELHDMRVATRRMRTAFDVFSSAFEQKTMKEHLKGLRGIGRALGQVRDMDVILEKALAYQSGMKEAAQPGLDPLMEAWKRRLDKTRNKLVKHLQSTQYELFKRSFNEFLQPAQADVLPAGQVDEATSRIRDAIPVLVYSRYASVRTYDAVLPRAKVSQLHALRIEFKKFRYTLEYFREVLGETAGKAINELKQYQDHLGELHDADVACQLVLDFLEKWEEVQAQQPIHTRINPEPIVGYLAFLHAERHRLMVAFPSLWQKFNRPDFRHNLAQAISRL